MEQIQFNLNNYVKVKLNDKGMDIYFHQFDELNQRYGREMVEPHFPDLDEDGYYKTQLWYLMELFSEHIHLGFDPPFETNIILIKGD